MMRFTAFLMTIVSACSPVGSSDTSHVMRDDSASDDGELTDTATTDTDEEELHPLGLEVPDFALLDINPSSESYQQTLSSADLVGQAYSVIFLDSRCVTCIDVIEDLWAEQLENPNWAAALPLFAVQSIGGGEMTDTVQRMVEGHDMPYLQDTEEQGLWGGYQALNHDFFAVSELGMLDVWLPLYIWPQDLSLYREYMQSRFK